jgi:hypothetical protein
VQNKYDILILYAELTLNFKQCREKKVDCGTE